MADQGSGGRFSPYLRQRRLEQAIPLLQGRVLDFGCGVGLLAAYCGEANYLGIDCDEQALSQARVAFPRHSFASELPAKGSFDTVVGLAVLEHLRDPAGWLTRCMQLLSNKGKIVLTTPHPAFRLAHECGARIGLFSREAADEHESFFDTKSLGLLVKPLGMELKLARRFLFGANQLFILEPRVVEETQTALRGT